MISKKLLKACLMHRHLSLLLREENPFSDSAVENTLFVVSDSYKKDGYGVYKFSDFLQVGVRKTEHGIERKLIIDEETCSDEALQRRYGASPSSWDGFLQTLNGDQIELLQNRYIRTIDTAIVDHINRARVISDIRRSPMYFSKSESTKQSYVVENFFTNSIARHLLTIQKSLDVDMSSDYQIYKEITENNSENLIQFEVGAKIEKITSIYNGGKFYLKFYILRNKRNLDLILENTSLLQDIYSSYGSRYSESTDYSTYSEIAAILAYYSQPELYEKLMSSKVIISGDVNHIRMDQMIKNIYEKLREVHRPGIFSILNRVLSMNIYDIKFNEFNYETMDPDLLRRLYDNIIKVCDSHKTYVKKDAQRLEYQLFSGYTLNGHKNTKKRLGDLLRISEMEQVLKSERTPEPYRL